MSRRALAEDVGEVLVTEQQIEAAVGSLAQQLTADYADKSPLLVGVLTGAFVFMADLVRRLDFPLEVDFVAVSSYGDATVAGELELTRDVSDNVAGRHVLIVDDILDTGRTLAMLTDLFRRREAASVRTCCLLDKPSRRAVEFEADYLGLEIPDQFVVGYGLDFAQGYRNLPFVGVLRPELYES